MQLEEVRQLASGEKELADLLAEFQEVDRFYREVVAAMCLPGDEIEPVRNSADVTVSFQPSLSSNEAAETLKGA